MGWSPIEGPVRNLNHVIRLTLNDKHSRVRDKHQHSKIRVLSYLLLRNDITTSKAAPFCQKQIGRSFTYLSKASWTYKGLKMAMNLHFMKARPSFDIFHLQTKWWVSAQILCLNMSFQRKKPLSKTDRPRPLLCVHMKNVHNLWTCHDGAPVSCLVIWIIIEIQ